MIGKRKGCNTLGCLLMLFCHSPKNCCCAESENVSNDLVVECVNHPHYFDLNEVLGPACMKIAQSQDSSDTITGEHAQRLACSELRLACSKLRLACSELRFACSMPCMLNALHAQRLACSELRFSKPNFARMLRSCGKYCNKKLVCPLQTLQQSSS